MPSMTEFLLILVVCVFFIGPMLLAFAVTMLRGKDYKEPPDSVRLRELRKRPRRLQR
jgi:hypothetical protein